MDDKLLELPFYIRFAEDGDDDSGGDDDGSDSGDQDENDENDDDTDDDAEAESGKNVEGLKSALAKERASRRNFEKQAKALQREKEAEASKKKTDVEQATDRATKAETRATKLAAAFKDNAVNTAIIQGTSGMDPVDIEDILALVDRSGFDVEQDEDDPADVKIDKETVKSALKDLKKKKPHLFKKKNEEDEEDTSAGRSGSTVGSRERRTPKNANEDQLRSRYPALKQ